MQFLTSISLSSVLLVGLVLTGSQAASAQVEGNRAETSQNDTFVARRQDTSYRGSGRRAVITLVPSQPLA